MRSAADSEQATRAWTMAVIWAAVILFFGAQNLVRLALRGGSIDWLQAFLFEFLYWLSWILVIPALLYMARRFRLETGKWKRSVPIHLMGAALVAVLEVSAYYALKYAALFFLSPTGEVPEGFTASLSNAPILALTSYWKYGVFVAIYYAFDYYRKYQLKELKASQLEAQLATSQLQALKMQLHPHFLFNTLHSVSMLNLTDSEAANRVLVKLSDLLRVTLESASTQEVSLAAELDFLDRYLEIERIRFADRLEITMCADEDIYDALVPNLILQPLVENAIRHGIGPSSTASLLRISARREGDELILEVEDDGPGLPTGWTLERQAGLGLGNIRARLDALYEGRSRLELINRDRGLTARITIPLKLALSTRAEAVEALL